MVKIRFHDERLTHLATKETPTYAEDVRKMILKKLSSDKQKEYAQALMGYKKNLQPTFGTKIRQQIMNFMKKMQIMLCKLFFCRKNVNLSKKNSKFKIFIFLSVCAYLFV